MNATPKITLYSFTLDCQDPHALASFYAELLGWIIVPFPEEAGDEFAVVAPPGVGLGGYLGLTFQRNPAYQPPVWPEEQDAQQQMAHLDFIVEDLDAAVEHAVGCGAVIAPKQFTEDWTVMFDPAGHPFCLCKGKHVFASADFALK